MNKNMNKLVPAYPRILEIRVTTALTGTRLHTFHCDNLAVSTRVINHYKEKYGDDMTYTQRPVVTTSVVDEKGVIKGVVEYE